MIKEVHNIELNTNQYRKQYRENIRNDIHNAWDSGIEKFEFVGEYNYKYLAQYAKEEASNLLSHIVREQELEKKYKEKYQLRYFRFYPYRHLGEIIRISSRKADDRIHVYCTLNKDALEPLIDKLATEQKNHEDRAEERRLSRLAEARKTDAEYIANKYSIDTIRKALEIAEGSETGDSSKT